MAAQVGGRAGGAANGGVGGAAGGRQAYAEAVARLDAYVGGAEPDAVARTADEVLAVARLLAGQPRLRRALTDPARDGQQRAELLRGLLADRIGAEPLELLTILATGRWSVPSELLNATERLGVEALLASAERAGDLAEVEDELFRFGQVVGGDPQLAATLGDSTALPARRSELVRDLLADKARPATVRLAELAVSGFAGRSFARALTRLVEFAADRRDRQLAYVTVAAALGDDEERRLAGILSSLYGREVDLKIMVDPSVLGGMSLRIGHDLYDGTVLRRLVQTRHALVGERR